MIKTIYSLFGNLSRLSAVLTAFWILLIVWINPEATSFYFISLIGGLFIFGTLSLALTPDIELTNDGLVIYRIYGLVKEEVKYTDIYVEMKRLRIREFGFLGDFLEYVRFSRKEFRSFPLAYMWPSLLNYKEIISFLRSKVDVQERFFK